MRKNDKNLQYENCILCGALTDIPVSMPINLRENYISGAGQLCQNCKNMLWCDENRDNKVSDRELVEILNSLQKNSD